MTGVRIARWVAKSTAAREVSLPHNKFGVATYLAMADALSTNSSLRVLVLLGNLIEEAARATAVAAFKRTLRINSRHPADSIWYVFDTTCLLKELHC